MFNPFVMLTMPLLEAFVKAGKTFFVRQHFATDRIHHASHIKASFLFSHYAEIGHAQHHYGAIAQDPYKYIYQWENADDQKKLITAASQPRGYHVFASVFAENWQKKLTTEWKQKLRRYIEEVVKDKPSAHTPVDFEIYVHYGELYVRFKLRNQEVRVKLEEIENYK
jgi:hypothetical protein